MTLREAEQQRRLAVEREERRVMSFAEWCELNNLSRWTARRLIKAGKGPLAVFVIATAGIDENGQPILPDEETLNADDQISARRILKTRHELGAIFVELLVRAVAEKL